MVTVSIGYCALPLPIKRTQSVGVNHLPLGIAITVAQDNYEVQFKEELYKRFQICQKTSNSQSGIFQYYRTTQALFVVSYAEHCFVISSVINLPDISQFEG